MAFSKDIPEDIYRKGNLKKTAINSCRTRAAKKEAQKQYAEANSEVKRNIRSDKRNFVDRIAQEGEEAATSAWEHETAL